MPRPSSTAIRFMSMAASRFRCEPPSAEQRRPHVTETASKVAVIGAGIMGSAIATRLIATGNFVTIFDLDAAKVAALVEKGGHATETVAAATAASDFVILSLNHANI